MIIGLGLHDRGSSSWRWRGKSRPTTTRPSKSAGLYWHFVDIVWIFLFPLLYLLGATRPH